MLSGAARGLEASETYDSLPAASLEPGIAKHTYTRTRTVAETSSKPFPFSAQPMPLHPPLHPPIYAAVKSFARQTTAHNSLRQLAEMPSLAGLKSRAHLASFARLEDGAFCRVISASLWAPPRPRQVVQAGASYGQLHAALPLAARVPFSFASPNTCSSHYCGPALGGRHAADGLRAGVLVRYGIFHATADLAEYSSVVEGQRGI